MVQTKFGKGGTEMISEDKKLAEQMPKDWKNPYDPDTLLSGVTVAPMSARELEVLLRDTYKAGALSVLEVKMDKRLRVWWVPQVPMKPFHYYIKDVETAIVLLDVLSKYDFFQLNNRIKPDFSNAGGLEMLEDGEWIEYEDDQGQNIDDIIYERTSR